MQITKSTMHKPATIRAPLYKSGFTTRLHRPDTTATGPSCVVADRWLRVTRAGVWFVAFVSLAPFMFAVIASAQNERLKATNTVSVVLVSDAASGTPLPGAIVRDSLSGKQVTTGVDGVAKLKAAVAAGPFYLFTISKLGFRRQSVRLRVAEVLDSNAIVLVDLSHLEGSFTTLDPVVTTATAASSKNMQGFESRRRNVGLRGKFVTPAELRTKWRAGDIHDLFLSDGLLPISTTGKGKGRGTCPIAYFVDGVRWNDIPTQTNAYEAIEFYPSALMAPVDIIGSLAFDMHYCGIYVLWLREPN